MVITVKPAPDDFAQWEQLLQLIQAAFAFQHARIDPPSSLHSFDAAALAAKARSETLFLALEQEALVGCVFAKPMDSALYIGKLAVSPQHQGRGIGRKLLQAAEGLARQRGLDAIELETRIELTENHEAFRAWGFVKTSERAHSGYSRPTCITMRKPLGQLPTAPATDSPTSFVSAAEFRGWLH